MVASLRNLQHTHNQMRMLKSKFLSLVITVILDIRISAKGWQERRKSGLSELEIFNEIGRDQGQPMSTLQDLGIIAPSTISDFIIFSLTFPQFCHRKLDPWFEPKRNFWITQVTKCNHSWSGSQEGRGTWLNHSWLLASYEKHPWALSRALSGYSHSKRQQRWKIPKSLKANFMDFTIIASPAEGTNSF